MRFAIGFVILCLSMTPVLLNAQDFGVEDGRESEVIEDQSEAPNDPYRLTFRIRPLSYFLFPITTSRLGSFNARMDYAFSRNFTLGMESNYYYRRPFAGSQRRVDALSMRLDANYFLFKKSNMDRYAEGFHFGAYYKFKYDDTFDPFINNQYGTSRIVRAAHLFGPIIGWQYVKNKFVFDQSIGFGAGPASSNVGILIVPDFRLGLSIGTVVLQ